MKFILINRDKKLFIYIVSLLNVVGLSQMSRFWFYIVTKENTYLYIMYNYDFQMTDFLVYYIIRSLDIKTAN